MLATELKDFKKIVEQELKLTIPNIKGFFVRNLKNMKKYYIECSKSEKVQTSSAQIPWSAQSAIDLYRAKGYDEKWIAKRIKNIQDKKN